MASTPGTASTPRKPSEEEKEKAEAIMAEEEWRDLPPVPAIESRPEVVEPRCDSSPARGEWDDAKMPPYVEELGRPGEFHAVDKPFFRASLKTAEGNRARLVANGVDDRILHEFDSAPHCIKDGSMAEKFVDAVAADWITKDNKPHRQRMAQMLYGCDGVDREKNPNMRFWTEHPISVLLCPHSGNFYLIPSEALLTKKGASFSCSFYKGPYTWKCRSSAEVRQIYKQTHNEDPGSRKALMVSKIYDCSGKDAEGKSKVCFRAKICAKHMKECECSPCHRSRCTEKVNGHCACGTQVFEDEARPQLASKKALVQILDIKRALTNPKRASKGKGQNATKRPIATKRPRGRVVKSAGSSAAAAPTEPSPVTPVAGEKTASTAGCNRKMTTVGRRGRYTSDKLPASKKARSPSASEGGESPTKRRATPARPLELSVSPAKGGREQTSALQWVSPSEGPIPLSNGRATDDAEASPVRMQSDDEDDDAASSDEMQSDDNGYETDDAAAPREAAAPLEQMESDDEGCATDEWTWSEGDSAGNGAAAHLEPMLMREENDMYDPDASSRDSNASTVIVGSVSGDGEGACPGDDVAASDLVLSFLSSVV